MDARATLHTTRVRLCARPGVNCNGRLCTVVALAFALAAATVRTRHTATWQPSEGG